MSKRPVPDNSPQVTTAPVQPNEVDVAILVEVLSHGLYDICTQTSDWEAFQSWIPVSTKTWTVAKEAMRVFLRPRYEAHVAAVKSWLYEPNPETSTSPYPYPSPAGPYPTWPILKRLGRRPVHAVPTETPMPRSLFVWAVSCALFSVPEYPAVDIDEAIKVYPQGQGCWDVAHRYFSGMMPEMYRDRRPQWKLAAHFSPLALLSTFTVASDNESWNMAAPGNNQYFIYALLAQFSEHVQNKHEAIAFLLFWGQHMHMKTYCVDSTFWQAVAEIIAHLVSDARGLSVHEYSRIVYFDAFFSIPPNQFRRFANKSKEDQEKARIKYEKERNHDLSLLKKYVQ